MVHLKVFCVIHFFNYKKGLSKCFTSSILPNVYDVNRRYFNTLCDQKTYFLLDCVMTIFKKCFKFLFVKLKINFCKESQ